MDQGTGKVEARLASLGLTIPAPVPSIGNFTFAVQTGNLVFVSGHGPWHEGKLFCTGKVDSEVSIADARQGARYVAINCIAALKAVIGDLDRVVRVVKLFGMVNSDPTFTRQPEIIDGASDLMTEVFGERGKHARAALGVAALPLNIAVEIEMIFEVSEG